MKRLKPLWKAKKEWRFIYSLAKELGKTVGELCDSLTLEEMMGWIAFAELESEDLKKDREKMQRGSALKGRRG